jgi:hypothetical protein
MILTVARILAEEANDDDEPILNQKVTPELADFIKQTIASKEVKVIRAVAKTTGKQPAAAKKPASTKASKARKASPLEKEQLKPSKTRHKR